MAAEWLPTTEQTARLSSLDACRGFAMLLLASGSYTLFREGFGLQEVASHFPENEIWRFVGTQFSHSAWRGITVWDLVMPLFIFMVGVAMSYSYAKRKRQGQAFRQMAAHAAYRAAVFIVLGSIGFIVLGNLVMMRLPNHLNIDFSNVLPQIGLAYFFAFLLVGRSVRLQLGVSLGILFIYWLAFALYPSDSIGPPKSDQFGGFYAHWNRGANVAVDVDRWLLNALPRTDPYVAHAAGMQTLNFIPTISTIIFGVMAGDYLRRAVNAPRTARFLVGVGIGAVIVGLAMDATVCPLVKALWTPSWAILSSGCALMILAWFYWIVDGKGYRRWAFPFIVVGANSLVAYSLANLADYWVFKAWERVVGKTLFVDPYGPVWKSLGLVVFVWFACFALYRREMFVRI